MFNEVFWELIVDKIITPGMTSVHTDLPWFHLHSQASENVKRLEQGQKIQVIKALPDAFAVWI